jgi:Tol biopolymer transport system component/DNA-binding winged helix-turn-helix (wHTH) protein
LASKKNVPLNVGSDPDGCSGPSPTSSQSSPEPPSDEAVTQDFALAGWRVHISQNRLSKDNHEITLEPKAMDVLVSLATAHGESVSRESLLETVWPHVCVADDSLHRAVSRLRRALAQSDELSNVVITVPRRGYRLDPELLSFALTKEPDRPGNTAFGSLPRSPTIGFAVVGAFAVCAALAIVALAPRFPTIDRSDLKATPFTAYAGQERAAAFSPDGKVVVFAWVGEANDNWDLYTQPIGEWAPKRLTTDAAPDFNPAWSPDGKTIAFVRIGGDTGCRIMSIPAQGGRASMLRGCRAAGDVDLAWATASDALYFTDRVGRSGPLAVHRLTLDSGAERQVTFPPPTYWGDALVRLAPSGEEIAFARTRALGVTDIYIADIAGGDEHQLTDDRLKIHGLDWSSDGERLYFSSNRGGTFGLWSIGKEGGKPQPLMAGINADSVAVSRSGGRLIFETEITATRLHRLSLLGDAGTTSATLTQASGWDWHPVVSDDGKRMAYISDRAGSPELWIAGIDGSNPAKLTNFGGPYANAPAWSRDGSRLALTVPIEGNFDIYTVDAATGATERLTSHPASDRNPSWSGDGRSVYFGSNRTGQWEIWRFDTSAGTVQQLTTNGGFRGQESVDRQLLYVKREIPGLFSVPANGRLESERIVSDRLLPLDWANWQLAGSDVFFIARDSDTGAALVQVSLATGREISNRQLPEFPYNSGLAIAADGSFAVYTTIDMIAADLVLLEGFEG